MSLKRFDRIARYRLAALLLLSPILIVLFGREAMPVDLIRVIYWSGTALVVYSVLEETWHIHRNRRKINKLLDGGK